MSDYVRYASLEVQQPVPEPAKVVLRNSDGFPGVVMSETDAWELYLLLDKHFGGNGAKEQAE